MPSAPLRFCTRHGTASPDGCPACQQTYRRHQTGRTAYNSPRWVKASRQFRADNPFCINADNGVPTCTLVTEVTDHRIPHQGDERLFWDRSNWQPMCWSCHSRKSLEEARSAR
jgi:5-methylcytosine-specific restriction protein A